MELKNIAILGPGGNVGAAVISELSKRGNHFKITAITRLESKYIVPAGSESISHRPVDYSSFSSLYDVFTGQDVVVNCITGGATQYEPSKRIIDAAVAAGVKFFFANEFVGYVTSEQYKRMPEAYVGAKVRIRDYLQELSAESKITWTSLNGGPFFDMWIMRGPAGFDLKNRRARIYGTGNNPLYWTPLPSIATAVVNMLQNPGAVSNRPIYICPFDRLTQNLILEAVQKIVGSRFDVEAVDVKKMNENAKLAIAQGQAAKAIKTLALSNQFYEGDSGNNFSHLIENETVGIKAMSIEDAIQDAIARYGPDTAVVETWFKIEPCEV